MSEVFLVRWQNVCYIIMLYFSTRRTFIRKGHQSSDKWLTLVFVHPSYSSGRLSLHSFLFRGTKRVVNLFMAKIPLKV